MTLLVEGLADAASFDVNRLQEARVQCIGDIILDRFIDGTVDRVSPEAPIPVLRTDNYNAMPGGVGNVARNIESLGGQAILHAIIGNDKEGEELAELASDNTKVHLITDSGRPTTVKTRYLAGTQQLLRTDDESTLQISNNINESLLDQIAKEMPECNAIVLSDYGKGVLRKDSLSAIISAAEKHNIPVLVDPQSSQFADYRGATVITPNRSELMAATGLSLSNDDEIAAAGQKLRTRFEYEALVITRGSDGLSVITANDIIHLPAVRRAEVYDVSGAGDTVIAVLAVALSVGANLPTAAVLANSAGSIAVGKARTAIVRPDELVATSNSLLHTAAPSKICSVDQALERIAVWRRLGKTFGFTNGCFDLLHPGHISLLNQTHSLCDHLIVGLNSDNSVERLKGKGRPIQAALARAEVLSSLANVDLVVIFDEDTPLDIIKKIRPDILVKGADYKLDDIVGGSFVRSYGGKVVLADLVPGHSDTDIIRRASR